MLLEKITDSVGLSWFFRITLAKIRTFSWLFQHPCPITGLFRSWKMKSQISGLFRTFQDQWEPWFLCGKSTWNGVVIFVHFFTTPISILNLSMSLESHENKVSSDILFERKYSQLFTHESNIFLLKQFRANRFTDAVQRWRRSLFIDCAQTDRQQASQYIPRRSLRSLGGYN